MTVEKDFIKDVLQRYCAVNCPCAPESPATRYKHARRLKCKLPVEQCASYLAIEKTICEVFQYD